MLEVRQLTKRYGSFTAVQNLSFRIEKGQCLGLLGPNGAGKTTTISIIVGALKADEGQVLLDGRPLSGETDKAKQGIGFVPQELALYDEMSASDNLRFFGTLYGLSGGLLRERIQKALQIVGLSERETDAVATFSGGMKRRLNITVALLHEPQLLILDEPTVGVDPQSRNAIFDNVQTLNREHGITVLYTTHYMEEVERLCDHVAIMDDGQLVANGTLPELYNLLPAKNRLYLDLVPANGSTSADAIKANGGNMQSTAQALQTLPGVKAVALTVQRLRIDLNDLAADVPRVLQFLAQHGYGYTSIASERGSLEEVFLHLTGRKLRDL
ncbi:MAG TPA: ABC transporter ATP-binding protein [Abditibacteriaceae bacterium]|jgi:ABC-2 type transport system ATP-binding protein